MTLDIICFLYLSLSEGILNMIEIAKLKSLYFIPSDFRIPRLKFSWNFIDVNIDIISI